MQELRLGEMWNRLVIDKLWNKYVTVSLQCGILLFLTSSSLLHWYWFFKGDIEIKVTFAGKTPPVSWGKTPPTWYLTNIHEIYRFFLSTTLRFWKKKICRRNNAYFFLRGDLTLKSYRPVFYLYIEIKPRNILNRK